MNQEQDGRLLIATAGHVDHGKSTLVKVLTGIDPDRFSEEKARGITIDLGFASYRGPFGSFSFVDVPGHERFVHNMLAGIGCIDAALLVIAADESIMPQTQEHARALSWLGLSQVLVVITKVDLVDEELLAMLHEELDEWLAPFGWSHTKRVEVTIDQPESMDTVLAALSEFSKKQNTSNGSLRVTIDRVFSSSGAGTVITGCLDRGHIQVGDDVISARTGTSTRIRELQHHGQSLPSLRSANRLALNLTHIAYQDLQRGDLLMRGPTGETAKRVLLHLKVFNDGWQPSSQHLFHLHHLSFRTTAKQLWREGSLCAVELSQPYPFWALDRGFIRDGNPLTLIAGFEVVHPTPGHAKRKHFKTKLAALTWPLTLSGWQTWYIHGKGQVFSPEEVQAACGFPLDPTIVDRYRSLTANYWMDQAEWERSRNQLVTSLLDLHKQYPHYSDLPVTDLQSIMLAKGWHSVVFDCVLKSLVQSDEIIRHKERIREAGHLVIIKPLLQKEIERMLACFRGTPIANLRTQPEYQTTWDDLVRWLLWEGWLISLDEDHLTQLPYITEVTTTLSHWQLAAEFEIGDFKNSFNLSRKHAVILLEYLDRQKLTLRIGNQRSVMADPKPPPPSYWQP